MNHVTVNTKNAMLLGTAAWQEPNGVVVKSYRRGDFWLGCADNGAMIGARDNRHVSIVSCTRGGKGASIIIPNLCLWPGSAVILDPKGENAMVTARRRGSGSKYSYGIGQRVYVLDPMEDIGTPEDNFADLRACYNPLDLIKADSDEAIDIAARIAAAFDMNENTSDRFFDDSARFVLQFVILHVATAVDFRPQERNLGTVRRLLVEGDPEAREIAMMNGDTYSEPPSPFKMLFVGMQHNKAFGGAIIRAGVSLEQLEQSSPRTFASVLAVARTNTDFLESPGMQRCVSQSDLNLSDLKRDPEGISVYLCLPQRFMVTHVRWLRMMVTLITSEMEREKRQPASGHPVLMILDEFPMLRRMPVIENAAAQIAGFGVKLCFVVQSLAQLKDIYKDNWETFVSSAGIKLFFCNDDHFTREYASKLIGEREVIRVTRSITLTEGVSTSSTSAFRSAGGAGTSRTTTRPFRFLSVRTATNPPSRSMAPAVSANAWEIRHPTYASIRQRVRTSSRGCAAAAAMKRVRSPCVRYLRLPVGV